KADRTQPADVGTEQDRGSGAAGGDGEGRRGRAETLRPVPARVPGRQPAAGGGEDQATRRAPGIRSARRKQVALSAVLPTETRLADTERDSHDWDRHR